MPATPSEERRYELPELDPTYQGLRHRRNLFGALAILFLLTLVGTAVLDEVASVDEDTSFTVGPSPGLVVRDGVGGGLRGAIEVSAGAAGRVHLTGKVHGTWRVRYRLEQRGDDVVIDVQPRPFLGWLGLLGPARFAITAPADTRLDVDSRSAPITVAGIRGGGSLRTTNGMIRIDDAGGDLSAWTVNGRVVVAGFEGNAKLETTNGAIDVERSRGAFDLLTTNGAVYLEAELATDARHRAETVNGAVRVRLEGEPSLRVSARTTNGAVVARRPISASQQTPHSLAGVIGAGAGELSLQTTNGSITIE